MIQLDNIYLEETYNNSLFIYDIFKENNIGVFSSRGTGKTLLSFITLLRYITEHKKSLVYIISNDTSIDIIFEKINTIQEYSKVNYNGDLIYHDNIFNFYRNIDFINALKGRTPDVVVIDEMGFTDLELCNVIGVLNARGVKLILNGSLSPSQIKYVKELTNIKIIDENVIDNLNHYSKKFKINKIICRTYGT